MNEQTDIYLSRSADDDLSEAELDKLIGSMDARPELRQHWFHLHLISDVLKGNDGGLRQTDLADRIRAQIDAEPAILAPTRQRHSIKKPVLGFAIAASVAAVVVVGVLNSGEYTLPGQESLQPGMAVNTDSDLNSVLPVATTSGSGQSPRMVGFDESGNAQEEYLSSDERINRYLIQHNEQQSGFGINPYARVISFESPQGQQ